MMVFGIYRRDGL